MTRIEEHIRSLQTLVDVNVDRKVELADAVVKIREFLESGRSIDRSDYCVKILKVSWGIQRLSGVVELKNLELQTMAGLIDEASSLQKDLSNLQEERNRLMTENRVVPVVGTENSELMKPTDSIVGSLQEVKRDKVKNKGDLKRAQETTTVSGPRQKR